uniref:Putative pre-16S rRNA nuclease n=1 Tax=Candidatus Aschnera chinzeii TaxID=1485666 RepID=A0AAT9G448_9ENTR|nr:MAG: Holliday junction resolvase RuvX [Candidatus Aschnera chinzeii]
MKNKIIVGIDFGISSIGVAVGQTLTGSSRPLIRIKVKEENYNWYQFKKIFFDWRPELFIIGISNDMNGKEKYLNKKIYKFADFLHGIFKIPVIFHDERLTTIEAKNFLFTHGGYRMLTKDKIDAVSAVIILNSWMCNNTSYK